MEDIFSLSCFTVNTNEFFLSSELISSFICFIFVLIILSVVLFRWFLTKEVVYFFFNCVFQYPFLTN